MSLAQTLRRLARRWYILLPGLLVACAAAIATWTVVPAVHYRSASELLIPSSGSFAPNTGNPFLNLDGLGSAADVLVDALNADDVAGAIEKEHPRVRIVVERDPANSGPALLFQVAAPSDREAREVLHEIVGRMRPVLSALQDAQSIDSEYRVRAIRVTSDQVGAIDQKNRLTLTVLSGVAVVVLTVLLAALVDGLGRRRTPSTRDAATRSEQARRDQRWRVRGP